ncbi:TonB-dependent receptor [Sphingobium sp. H33]|uniref:TonB-dependent receptor n=1 Tax=Sphingobium nicotianae TaxID=2782607 RepID=A0A9X1IQ20_9SPHN|nr:TonB-dependent receptor [Sphingobium nicotianae]
MSTQTLLKVASAPAALGLALLSTAAFAQTAQNAEADEGEAIIVTGSITRNPAAATASPVVSISADDLQKRGIPTATEYLQTLTANNAGTVPPSWSAFGFTTGASAPSLRGFNDAYTLVLFDGMRTAVYPLADDTQRNIVDINTIPNSVIGNVDTLLDGASATYGSDAIAGVVNVITKRQIQGLHLNGSAGISQRGDAGEQRISASYGIGDLDRDGFNVYIAGEYQHNDTLYSRQRSYPFNTGDLSRICGDASQGCLNNAVRNGIQYDGSYLGFQSSRASATRPFNSTPLTFVDPGGVSHTYAAGTLPVGPWQYLNGCGGLASAALTPGQQGSTSPKYTAVKDADGNITGYTFNNIGYTGAVAPSTVCQEDLLGEYQMYSSSITRKGGTLRATKTFGDSEVFAMFNYYNTTTFNEGTPRGWTGSTAAGGRTVTVSRIFLPVYVCPQGTAIVGTNPSTGNITGDLRASGCNAGNGTLNPNNPFAAQGGTAQLSGLPDRGIQTFTDAKVYRGAIGAHGSFGQGWDYNVGVTASEVTLDVRNHNYIYLQGLMNAIATGSYNFVNPSANTQAVIDSVFKDQTKRATSKLFQAQAAIAKDLIELPGGMLNVAVGGQFRHESLNNPSSNAPNDTNPYARYYTINGVGVQGERDIWSASYEITVPIVEQLRAKASGSYDHYSTGQTAFSPKFEAEFTPIKEVKIRGTWSKGFRAPNFNESFQLPSTGYSNASIVCSNPTFAAFCAAHASNPSYYASGYSPGLTSSGNSNLEPEKSTSYTFGLVLQPRSSITFTVDYWHTKIKNVIIPPSVTSDITTQYYTNNGVVNIPGINVVKGNPDPQNPNALPLLGFIEAPFQNANAIMGEGIDISADVKLPITNTLSIRSVANASYLMKLQQELKDGTIWRADGTLGPCGWTSCSGAPSWRVTWQNTLDVNDQFNATLTASYTSGYSPTAADSGGTYKDCAQSAADGQLIVYDNGDPVQCHVHATFNLDGHVEVKVADKFTLYGDVLNILNSRPPLDVNAGYALYQFNPAWADRGFIGRYFRVGAKVDF